MGDVSNQILDSFEARQKYRYFRILVIGRANAGKTTLLKRVCNTTEEPCIYDEKSNSLLEPTSERGIHDIDRPFAFASNPQFIFHDSPGFETGDERFCFIPNISRFLLDLEKRFFDEQRAGNIPVIAIFTKFDHLISQVYDIDLEDDENRQVAESLLKNKLRAPLFEYKFPPRADVCLEDMHNDDGNHQEQVKVLIEKTAESLDNLALKILFVSVAAEQPGTVCQICGEYAPNPMSSVPMVRIILVSDQIFPALIVMVKGGTRDGMFVMVSPFILCKLHYRELYSETYDRGCRGRRLVSCSLCFVQNSVTARHLKMCPARSDFLSILSNVRRLTMPPENVSRE
ncbi:hypothetical protein H4582DRAFT_2105768 [Lactarius indigo]|nr:hypothetical protein H4582DRAFT_2105768 [Lactarius indigo]